MRQPTRSRLWLAAALLLTAAKLWFAQALPVRAIGGSIHDDALFLQLAEHFLQGRWLGPYTQLTLAGTRTSRGGWYVRPHVEIVLNVDDTVRRALEARTRANIGVAVGREF